MNNDLIIQRFADAFRIGFQKDSDTKWLLEDLEIFSPEDEDSTGKWDVYYSICIPGVRWTANGDGWPDEYDVNLLSSHDNLWDALQAAGEYKLKQWIENGKENVAEDAIFAEEEEYLCDYQERTGSSGYAEYKASRSPS